MSTADVHKPTEPAEAGSLSPPLDAELRTIAEHSAVPRGSARSRAITVVAGYFNVVAVLSTLGVLVTSWFTYNMRHRLGPAAAAYPWFAVNRVITIAMQFRVGKLLHRRRREGGYWALGALAMTLVSAFRHSGTLWTQSGIAMSLVGVGLIAYAWKELE